MYSSTISLTSELDGCGWSTPRLGCFTPGKDPVHIVQEAGWVPRLVWTDMKIFAPTGIQSPDPPARSEPLYLLSYRDPQKARSTNYKAPHYVITSILLLLPTW